MKKLNNPKLIMLLNNPSKIISWGMLIYVLISLILNQFSFYILSYFLILYSSVELITTLIYKKSSNGFGIVVTGKDALLWGLIRFLFFFGIGVILFILYKPY